jgi:hypothetical protein
MRAELGRPPIADIPTPQNVYGWVHAALREWGTRNGHVQVVNLNNNVIVLRVNGAQIARVHVDEGS